MNRSVIQIACAAAFGVLAAAAQAQTTSASPATSDADLKAQADASYAAAKSVCEKQGGTSKLNCLRNAKADYERWLKTGEVDTSTQPGTASSGTKGAGSHAPDSMAGKQQH
jgi:hypothetical protein